MSHAALAAHHQATIERVVQHFRSDAGVLALLLTGSLAHGFARASSDVDVAIVVAPHEYQRRQRQGELSYYNEGLSTYAGGYVDGKYVDLPLLMQVAEQGSEPARFAFQDARILYSEVDGLADLLQAAARYPVEHKAARQARFLAQLEAWHWYVQQAEQTVDAYLLRMASTKLALFGCRLVLSHNELLYPYHKWLTRVVRQAPHQPEGFMALLDSLLGAPSASTSTAFFDAVKGLADWPAPAGGWPAQFMFDSELNWLAGDTPVDDL